MNLFGGIEAGGTKFNCIVTDQDRTILAEARFPTTTPNETLGRVIQFFQEQQAALGSGIRSLGVACFGPLDPDPTSPTYGYITTTPKAGWGNTPVVSALHQALGVPVAMDTDVNAAAIAEGLWGAAQGLTDFIYLTIGTGVGGGPISHGKPIHGLIHPEMGHVLLRHDHARDPYAGKCPYHADCFEGLASGPALEARWGTCAENLPADHPAWELEAHYIALALEGFICTLSPQRIILGGGVMAQTHLFPLIHAETLRLLHGYVHSAAILEHIEEYIVAPGLGSRAGVMGGIALAQSIQNEG